MKDGRTHLAHKAEHAVDMESGAVIGVTVQEATLGDPTSLKATMVAAVASLQRVAKDERCAEALSEQALTEWVADRGYHSNATMKMVEEVGLRSYISEPKRGRRRWKDKHAERDGTYSNRRRLKTERGNALMRRRGELIERCFAHCLETGAMRRLHLRGRMNILKRYLLHVAAFDLSLVMRSLIGVGTPRGLQGGLRGLAAALSAWIVALVLSVLGGWKAPRHQLDRVPLRGGA